jgi:hypothetical protein
LINAAKQKNRGIKKIVITDNLSSEPCFRKIIHSIDLAEYNFSWKRENTNNNLWSFRTGTVLSVNKQGKSWDTPFCRGCLTLREAKAASITHLKNQLVAQADILDNIISTGKKNEGVELSLFEYVMLFDIVNWIIRKNANNVIATLGLSARLPNERFGNAITAFDVNGHMISLLESRPNYAAAKNGNRLINPQQIGVSFSISQSISQPLLQRNRDFGRDGLLTHPMKDFSELSIVDAIQGGVDKAMRFAGQLKAA